MFRTADALGIDQLFLTGYCGTPPRKEISKVALGAEEFVSWKYYKSPSYIIDKLKKEGVKIVALETGDRAIDYTNFKPKFPLALIVGNEVRGISKSLLAKSDYVVSLPMRGIKESLNVGVSMGAIGYYINQYRN